MDREEQEQQIEDRVNQEYHKRFFRLLTVSALIAYTSSVGMFFNACRTNPYGGGVDYERFEERRMGNIESLYATGIGSNLLMFAGVPILIYTSRKRMENEIATLGQTS